MCLSHVDGKTRNLLASCIKTARQINFCWQEKFIFFQLSTWREAVQSVGDITNLKNVNSRQQELDARLWGYNRLIGLRGIIRAFEHHCQNRYEMAEYLDVTEDYLEEALACYRSKYGVYTVVDNYAIYFIPNIAVAKRF